MGELDFELRELRRDRFIAETVKCENLDFQLEYVTQTLINSGVNCTYGSLLIVVMACVLLIYLTMMDARTRVCF